MHEPGRSANVEEAYFKWLYKRVGVVSNRNPATSHFLVLDTLIKLDYYWTVPNDDNREQDGLELRDEFCDEHGSWEGSEFPVEAPCSVLEFLIGLAKRMAYMGDGLVPFSSVGEWFWHMMHNLGLDGYTDLYCLDYDDYEESIVRIITKLLDRTYEYDGEGGLFPLAYPQRDQRDVEIWYQLNSYILENSDIADY